MCMMRNNSSCSSADSRPEPEPKNKTTVLKKGPWSAAEDAVLVEYVGEHGEGNWNSVQKNCGLARCGKSCRLRWANHLRPNLKKGSFTPEEEMLIVHLHAQYGNKWARMAAQMPGRTDNEIKNYWNTRIKRRQRAGLPIYPARLGTAQPPGGTYCSFVSQDCSRVKRARDDGVASQFHTPGHGLGPYANGAAMNIFHNSSINSVNMAEVHAGDPLNEGQCRIMDALLWENGGDNLGRKFEFGNCINGNRGGKDFFAQCLPKFDQARYSNGMRILKREREESDETINVSSTNDDISKIFDMISVPTMPQPPDQWPDNAIDYCQISNGARSSVINGDEFGLELQHFSSAIAQTDQEWKVTASCTWNNLPEVG